MIETNRIGIVILNYQSYKDTIKLLKNLYEINKQLENLELITCVVDNASPDESVTIIKKELEDLYSQEPFFLLPLENNAGYSTGNNAGIKFLLEKDCQYIFIMNNDIEINDSNFFPDMLTSIINSKAAIVGPGVIQKGKLELPLKRKRPSFTGIILENFLLPIKILSNKRKRQNLKKKKEIQNVYSVSGCCFLFDTQQALKDGKLFDDRLFLYEEETILGERMYNNGLLVMFNPTTSVIHIHGATITKHYDKKKQDKIKDQSFRIYLDDYRLDFNNIQKSIIMFSRNIRWKYEQIIANLK